MLNWIYVEEVVHLGNFKVRNKKQKISRGRTLTTFVTARLLKMKYSPKRVAYAYFTQKR